jgi:hypothetical protein
MSDETDYRVTLHGPMWEFECKECGEVSDSFDTPEGRDRAVAIHTCALTRWVKVYDPVEVASLPGAAPLMEIARAALHFRQWKARTLDAEEDFGRRHDALFAAVHALPGDLLAVVSESAGSPGTETTP